MGDYDSVIDMVSRKPLSLSESQRGPNIDEKKRVSFGDGNGGGGNMDADKYIDAKIDTVRAQNDARFAEVVGKLGNIEHTLSGQPSVASLIGTSAITALTILGLIVALLAFGGDRFDGGVQVSSVVVQQAQDAKALAQKNQQKMGELSEKLDILIGILGEQDK